MGALSRLWEKLTGTPHRHDESLKVRIAANELKTAARDLRQQMQPYIRAHDPFAALMAEMSNRDQLTRIHKGPP